jgi:hypothetical protein
MIKPGLFRVTDMVEKPKPEDAPSNLAIIGRYILTPDIFEKIEQTEPGKGGEIQITDALMKQAAERACWHTNSKVSVLTAAVPRATSKQPTSASRTSTKPVSRLTNPSALLIVSAAKATFGWLFRFCPHRRLQRARSISRLC